MAVRQSRYFLAFTLYTAALLPAPYPLIRYSRCIIPRVNDATAGKLRLLNEMNHAFVGLVGVNANVAALC